MWNIQSQKKKEMFFVRDELKNILDYCDYSRLGYVISQFTAISPDILNFGITFPLSTSQRVIECSDIYIPIFVIYVNQIHRTPPSYSPLYSY